MENFYSIIGATLFLFIFFFLERLVYRNTKAFGAVYTFRLHTGLEIFFILINLCIVGILLFVAALSLSSIFITLLFIVRSIFKIIYILSIINNEIILTEKEISFVKRNSKHHYDDMHDNTLLSDIDYICTYDNSTILFLCLKKGNVKKFDITEFTSRYSAPQIISLLIKSGIVHKKIDYDATIRLSEKILPVS
jgi:hypothetical protein